MYEIKCLKRQTFLILDMVWTWKDEFLQWGSFVPQEAFGNAWKHYLLSQLWMRGDLTLMGGVPAAAANNIQHSLCNNNNLDNYLFPNGNSAKLEKPCTTWTLKLLPNIRHTDFTFYTGLSKLKMFMSSFTSKQFEEAPKT